jgi:diguanylate cyclase (GGDEF)-like protein/PAS domain S-box-containing protein
MARTLPPLGTLSVRQAASAVLSRTTDAAVFLDGRGRFRGANDRFWAWSNLDAGALAGRDGAELWEDPTRWRDWLTALRLGGAATAAEVLDLRTRDGDPIPVEVRLTHQPGWTGRPRGTVLVLEDLRPRRQAEALVRLDPLTGIPSRAALVPRLTEELGRTQLYATPLALVLMNIDGFGGLNDRWGPAFGDEVLRVAGAELRDKARPSDIPGRWGGGEFLVLLPQTALEPAAAAADRLRAGLEGRLFRPGPADVRVTASFGVVTVSARGHDTLASALARVREALEAARSRGANRIEVRS